MLAQQSSGQVVATYACLPSANFSAAASLFQAELTNDELAIVTNCATGYSLELGCPLEWGRGEKSRQDPCSISSLRQRTQHGRENF